MEPIVTRVAKRIKKEPEEMTVAKFEAYTLDASSYVTSMNGDDMLTLSMDTLKTPVSKHTSSPAQEATRAKISSCDVQLKRLYRLKSLGKLDMKGIVQIRTVEDERRKAQSKLKRLLNEAERQRRRRERIRRASSAAAAAPGAPKMMLVGAREDKRDAFHSYSVASSASAYPAQSDGSLAATSRLQDDVELMSSLRQCAKFEDFLKEINSLGFALTKIHHQRSPYDVGEVLENGTNDGEVKVQVELIEGDGVLDQNMTVIEPDIQEVKQEPPSPPATPPPPTVQETKSKDSRDSFNHVEFAPISGLYIFEVHQTGEQNRSAESSKKRPTSNANSNVKAFADEYARKYSKYVGEYQEQYQEWFEKQVESQQQWEETFMQEQMELAKSMLENVATTFLQSMQQVLQNVVSSMRHRTLTPFMPSFTQRSMDINGLSGNEFPVFISAEGASSSGPTVLSTRSLADESFNNM